ncbi:MAG: DUF3040 domain-containing protein [Actinomycetota bacterium]|nr:DUF3040 domain-containing protein [Actinomycetota bacterium]
MSTPDARLTAAEKAAFANLEAAAVAADPTLAARLRGRARWRSHPSVRATGIRALHLWVILLGLRVWGGPLVVTGFLLMALGLSAGLALSLLGAAMALLGLRMVAESVRVRLVAGHAGRPEDRRVEG